MNAYEWGRNCKPDASCEEALDWRKSLGPAATQSDAYLACERGDWLFWQLGQLPPEIYEKLKPKIDRALEIIILRAIRRVRKLLVGNTESWVGQWRKWARDWESGTDRSWAAARAASAARAAFAARAGAAFASAFAARAAFASASAAAARAGAASASAARAAFAARAGAAFAFAAASAAAARAGAGAGDARKRERRLQAKNIRSLIPTWPENRGGKNANQN